MNTINSKHVAYNYYFKLVKMLEQIIDVGEEELVIGAASASKMASYALDNIDPNLDSNYGSHPEEHLRDTQILLDALADI